MSKPAKGAAPSGDSASPRFATRDYLVALLFFALGAFIFCWPWLFGGLTIPWDAKAHFYPQLQFLARALHEGQSPFWTPNVFGGHPQIADPQSLIFSPPYLLLAALSPAPSMAAFDGVLFLMLFLGGGAIIALFRDEGWHPAGAALAAFAFAFGGSNAWRVQHVGQVLSMAWFAIALWLLLRAISKRSILNGALAGLAAGLMLVNRDQVAWLCTMLLAVFAIWRAIGIVRQSSFTAALRALALPLGAGALTGLLTIALPIALTLALAESSNRAEIDYQGAVGGSLHPAAFFTFVSANLFGTDGPFALYWGPPTTSVWGENGLALARNMADVYLGALPFVLLIVIGVFRGALIERPARMFTVAALAMIIYALGGYTPAFKFLFMIPGSDMFRRPADATFPLGAMLAVLGGYCLHVVMTQPRSTARALAGFITVALAWLACLGIAILKGRVMQAAPALVLTFACLVIAAVLAGLFLRRAVPALAAVGVIALAMTADLRVNNGPNESTALPARDFAVLVPGAANETLDLLRARLAAEKAPDRRDRIELAAIDFHWPNASLAQNMEQWLGYNPLRLKWFADATGAIDHVAIPEQRRFAPLFASYRSPMLDLLGVRYVATGVPAGELDKRFQPGDLTQIARTREAYVYENPRALPRVLFATSARAADFDAMTASGQWPDVDFRTTVLLQGAQPAAPRAPGSARIVSYANTDVKVAVDSPQGGWLVLNDVWHPWWRVEIGGKPADLLRANVMFRAVEVPAGAHEVRFVFRPIAGLLAQWARGG